MRYIHAPKSGAHKSGGRRANPFAGFLLAAVLSLAVFGCGNPMQPNQGAGDATGTLWLTLNGQIAGRTIMPDTTLDDFARFDLVFAGTAGTGGGFMVSDWDDGPFAVPVGTWNLTVWAYMPNPVPGGWPPYVRAASGTHDGLVVPAGGSIGAYITLYPVGTGAGVFAWEMTFHESVASAVMQITRAVGTPAYTRYITLIGPDAADNNPGSTSLQTGQYRVTITLYNTAGERAVAGEMLHIFQGLTSRFDGERATFSLGHFPVSLWNYILATWDGDTWGFAAAGITPRYFDFLGIEGVDDGTDSFVAGILDHFDDLAAEFGAPADIAALKAMVDAALVALHSPGIDTAANWYRVAVQNAIREIAVNGTPLAFDWGDDTVAVQVGPYRVQVEFDRDITPFVTGTVGIAGAAWIGETLVADITALQGAGEPTFQWQRGTGTAFTDIAGATDYYYVVQADDVGNAIRVRVEREGYEGYIIGGPTPIVLSDDHRVPGETLAEQLQWLRTYAQAGGYYVVDVIADETIDPVIGGWNQNLPTGLDDLAITVRGAGQERVIRLSFSGSHFHVPQGVTLALGENITLMGRGPNAVPATPNNNNNLVRVYDGGTFVMNEGSRITGNTNTTTSSAPAGGGVRVNSGGVFVLDGGRISSNTVTASGWTGAGWEGLGAGVRVMNGGRFEMLAGAIYDNEAAAAGGVYVTTGATFNISGGTIYGHYAQPGLANISRATGVTGSALFVRGTAGYGDFDPGWQQNGPLATTHYTIHVVAGVLQASVYSVTVSPHNAIVKLGLTRAFAATLGGHNPGAVTWTVQGNQDSGTAIDADGLLSIAPGETAQTITVRATSVLDPEIGDYVTVAVAPSWGITVPGHTIGERLAWLRDYAYSGNRYLIDVHANETLYEWGDGVTRSGLPFGRTGVEIILHGEGGERNVYLGASGILFTVESGITLVLEEDITLVGRCADGPAGANNNQNLVRVLNGGTFVMNAGSRLIGNTNSTMALGNGGGGVRVTGGGVFVLDGGEVSGNSSLNTVAPDSGGGVVIAGGGARFEMLSGTIAGNTGQNGGGVTVLSGGIFHMAGGEIHGHDADPALANYARGIGATLSNAGTAQFGTFGADGFDQTGVFITTDYTLRWYQGQPVLAGTVTLSTVAPVAGQAITATFAGTGTPVWQWLLDGTEIPGATGNTYTPVYADGGQTVSARASIVNWHGSVTGAATAPVTHPPATGVTVSPGAADIFVTMVAGGTRQFAATVQPDLYVSQAVTWTVSPATPGVSISDTGLLTVPAGVTETAFTVTATSVATPAIDGTATVTILPATGVTIGPANVGIAGVTGGAQQFTIMVHPVAYVPQIAEWTVYPPDSGATISATGLLTVAPGTVEPLFTVTATVAPDLYDVATVNITPAAGGFTISFPAFQDGAPPEIAVPDISVLNAAAMSQSISLVGDFGHAVWFFPHPETGAAVEVSGQSLSLPLVHGGNLGTFLVTVEVEADGRWFSRIVTFRVTP